ncbi:MAG: Unknown protein [uncultured Sulfurovum sp.]|uniref:Uncharacterized protein n=1 Tax=uncultured Sulfurovum sp. TaxID=269237 RepID=A0A6S6SKH0_9BACT|nr:MAG: Unknown protein [uncultured Sulfurovum sp.]
MEHVLPTYIKPFESIKEPRIDVDIWQSAIDTFDNADYKESLINLLKYINASVLEGVDTAKDIIFTKMQGSAEISVAITNERLKIEAPFLRVTDETNMVALLRRVTEINFDLLDLAQIVLEDDILIFRYETSLTTCQPSKIYTVLRNISFRADDYDDIFVEEYGAEFYKEPARENLSANEKQETLRQIREILKNIDDYSDFFVEDRQANYRWDIIVISLLRLSNMPYMQGKLRSELINNVERMYDGDVDFSQRINKGLLYIKELQAYSDEYYEKSLYHVEQFISLRWRSTPQIIEERMENHKETIESMNESDDHMAASYFLYAIFLKLIYNYNLDENYKNEIERVLKEVSEKNTKEAAPILLELYWDMYNVEVESKEEEEKKSSVTTWLSNAIWISVAGYLAYNYLG